MAEDKTRNQNQEIIKVEGPKIEERSWNFNASEPKEGTQEVIKSRDDIHNNQN